MPYLTKEEIDSGRFDDYLKNDYPKLYPDEHKIAWDFDPEYRKTFGKTSEEQTQFAPKTAEQTQKGSGVAPERGFMGDVASNLARGAADLTRMAGYGIKTLDPDGGIDIVENIGQGMVDAADKSQKWDVMKMDESEAAGENLFSRGWKGGVRSAVPSLSPRFAGAAAGAVIGSAFPVIGTAMGGMVGAGLATLGLFGLGTYGEKLHEYKSQGISDSEAETAAFKQALVEGGIETAASLIGLKIFGVDKFVTQPLKNTVKELLKTPMKTWGKRFAADTFLNEVPTEMLQGALGANIETGLGLQDEGAWRDAMIESIIPAMTMSLLFGAGSAGMTTVNKRNLKAQLNNMEDPQARRNAVEAIEQGIKENEKKGVDAEATRNAEAFANMALDKIDEGLPIDINSDFVEYASQDEAQLEQLRAEGEGAQLIEYGDMVQKKINNLLRFRNPTPRQKENLENYLAELEGVRAQVVESAPMDGDTPKPNDTQESSQDEEEIANTEFDAEIAKRQKNAKAGNAPKPSIADETAAKAYVEEQKQVDRLDALIESYKAAPDLTAQKEAQTAIQGLFSEGVPFNEGLEELEANITEFRRIRSQEASAKALEARQQGMGETNPSQIDRAYADNVDPSKVGMPPVEDMPGFREEDQYTGFKDQAPKSPFSDLENQMNTGIPVEVIDEQSADDADYESEATNNQRKFQNAIAGDYGVQDQPLESGPDQSLDGKVKNGSSGGDRDNKAKGVKQADIEILPIEVGDSIQKGTLKEDADYHANGMPKDENRVAYIVKTYRNARVQYGYHQDNIDREQDKDKPDPSRIKQQKAEQKNAHDDIQELEKGNPWLKEEAKKEKYLPKGKGLSMKQDTVNTRSVNSKIMAEMKEKSPAALKSFIRSQKNKLKSLELGTLRETVKSEIAVAESLLEQEPMPEDTQETNTNFQKKVFEPGQPVTWTTKKGKALTGTLAKKNKNFWSVTLPNGKKTNVHKKDLSVSNVSEKVPGDRRQTNVAPQESQRVEQDRRIDEVSRKKVDDMTPEEMKLALKTDHLTGLGNKRAYEESEKLPVQSSLDVDSLKWVNDNHGHEAGDELLKVMGEAFRGNENAYHVSGDEYVLQGNDQKEVENAIEKAYNYLIDNPMGLVDEEGNVVARLTGGFSYGTGSTLKEADQALRKNKSDREISGDRAARGDVAKGFIQDVSESETGPTQEVTPPGSTELPTGPTSKGQNTKDPNVSGSEQDAQPERVPMETQKLVDSYVNSAIAQDIERGKKDGREATQEQIDTYKTYLTKNTQEFVDAVNNKSFGLLKDMLHRGNKRTLKLFTDLTGLSTKTQKITDENIRSLDPVKYDEWESSKKQAFDDKVKEKEVAKKAKAEKDMLSSKVNYNGEVMTFEKYINTLLENGFTNLEKKENGPFPSIKLVKNPGTDPRTFRTRAFKKKIEIEYIEGVVGEHSEKAIAADAAKEEKEMAENPDAFVSQDEADHLFGNKAKGKPESVPMDNGVDREPWEMSREEYNSLPKFKQNIKAKNFGLETDKQEKYTTFNSMGVYSKDRDLHRDIIQKAIQQGKIDSHPDYPELTPPVQKSRTTEKTEQTVPTKKEVATLQPGQPVTWKTKKGDPKTGTILKQNGKLWSVKMENGKNTLVHGKDLTIADGPIIQVEVPVKKASPIKKETKTPEKKSDPDKTKLIVAKMRTIATKLKEDSEAKYSQDREENTNRRAQMAASARADASKGIQTAKTMLAIADLLESGYKGPLEKIKSKTHIDTLESLLRVGQYEKWKSQGLSYIDQQNKKGEAYTPEDVDHIKARGTISSHSDFVHSLRNNLREQRGGKKLAAQIHGKNLTPELAKALVDFEKKLKQKGVNFSLPWTIESQLKDYNRHKTMGIVNPEDMKAVANEYIKLRAGGIKEDPIKTAERKLVGTKPGIDFFPTPKTIANDLVDRADIQTGDRVLEPSAGKGDIADAIKENHPDVDLDTVELSSTLRELLDIKGHKVSGWDFLEHTGEYDKIIMNPPFSKGMDVDHVKHAYSLLKPGGKIVAIMGEHPFFANDKKSVEFREWLSDKGFDEKLPQGSFTGKEAFRQTGVNSRIVEIEKPLSSAKFSINQDQTQTPGSGVTLKDIQKRFTGQQVFISPDGSVSIKLKNGQGLRIVSAKHMSKGDVQFAIQTGRMDKGGIILGTYLNKTITLNKDFADTRTVDHETYHFLVDAGILTKKDRAVITTKFKAYQRKGKFDYNVNKSKEENEANAFAQFLDEREQYRGTRLGDILQKVVDFLDGLLHIGQQSARKLAKSVESGKVFEREVSRAGSNNLTHTQFQTTRNTATKAFKKWFGKSKVVDENGEPLVVYKGMLKNNWETGQEITEINSANGLWAGFFSSEKPVAEKFRDAFATMNDAVVHEVYLKIEKPYIVDAKGGYAKDFSFDDGVFGKDPRNPGALAAFNNGYDGVVIKNTKDEGDVYIPKNPTQIKSATGNNGQFDPNNPDIRFTTDQDQSSTPGEGVQSTSAAKLSTTADQAGLADAEDSFFQKASDMVFGNAKHWKDKGKNYDEDLSAMAHIFKTTMYNAEKIGGAYKRLWNAIRKQDDHKFAAQRDLWYEGDVSLLNGFKDFSQKFNKEYAEIKEYLNQRDIERKGFVVNKKGDEFNLLHWKKKDGKRQLLGTYSDKEAAWKDAIQIEAEESGFSSEGMEALTTFRKMSHNLYHHFARNLEEAIKAYETAGKPVPQITIMTENGEVKINLHAAAERMGDLRGSYFPRLRNSGKWRVKGTKNGKATEMQFFDTQRGFGGANAYRRSLERGGYKTEINKTGKLSEDVFAALEPLLAQQQVLNSALKDMSNEDKQRVLEDANIKATWRDDMFILSGSGVYNPEVENAVKHLGGKFKELFVGRSFKGEIAFEDVSKQDPNTFEQKVTDAIIHSGGLEVDMDLAFANSMVKQYDAVLKGRGARSRMIARDDSRGTDVVQGYEKDPVIAITQAMQAAAGSEAKAIIAKEGTAAISGRDIPWKDYQAQRESGAIGELEKELQELSLNTPEETARKEKLKKDLNKIRQGLVDSYGLSPNHIIKKQREIKKILDEIKKLTRWSDIKKAQDIKTQITQAKAGLYEDYLKMVDKRKINAATQEKVYAEATGALKDILRNQEFADRVLGTIKGLAVWQYLGFRVSSAAVNVTNMGLGVPAAINGETDNQVSITKALANVAKAMKDFGMHRAGNLAGEQKKVFDEIQEKGWDNPVFNREAFDVLSTKLGKGWNYALEKSMWMFGKTEEMNRAATITATYFSMKQTHKGKWDHNAMMEKAKDISDKAHGVYGVANRPYQMRGGNLAARVLQAGYVFQTFSHNWIQEMVRLGFDKKQYKAALYMAFAPAIFGIGATIPMGIAKAVANAIGGDDPEEKLIQLAEDSFGMGSVARNGVMGLSDHGVNLRGSLSTRFGVPSTFADIFGAPGSVVLDIYEGGKNITKGYYQEGFEKIAPAALGNISKGIRESTEGVTSRSGTPVFFGKNQLKGDSVDMILRMLSFNPTGISEKKEIQWNEYKVQAKYKEYKSDLYKKLKRFYSSPPQARDRAEWMEIKADIRDLNQELRQKKLTRYVPLITSTSIKATLRRLQRAPKRERLRAES